ncbi:MAG: thioesterase [Aeromicrobium sp.]|jgi:acyl-coenzyme A thioesterase PaaI-like protein|uniref:hotdog fold domain-containing protein n=1 Tax=Aeromicrobium sp. TaxID=1871063 RepID=UPI0026362FA4|nr:hotdog fold domain-containing protein [Aeromicrobium sp.]MCW2823671.1 thioesterase [Aeromicrobium sp.]
MPSTLDLYKKLTALPQGKRLFSIAFSQKAPYFASIHPRVQEMRPHLGQVLIPKRRSVQNHIGTVHAIAACNGLEAAMGLLAEATCPADMRWLPKGMEVSYLAKSTTSLTCIAETTQADWAAAPDVPVRVRAVTSDGTVTVEGLIHLWVTPKR